MCKWWCQCQPPPMTILQKHSHFLFVCFIERHRSIPEISEKKEHLPLEQKAKTPTERHSTLRCTGGKKYILQKSVASYLSTAVCSFQFGTSFSEEKITKKMTKIIERRERKSDSACLLTTSEHSSDIISNTKLITLLVFSQMHTKTKFKESSYRKDNGTALRLWGFGDAFLSQVMVLKGPVTTLQFS